MAVFLATTELCARFDDAVSYEAPFWGDYTVNSLRGRDGEGLPFNVPGARFEKWQHNSLGFRGPEVSAQKAAGAVRVVCLGTSESYGLYESPGKEWPAQLRALLRESGVEVVNASTVGMGLASYPAYLRKHVYPLGPDLVVVVVSPLFYVTALERESARSERGPEVAEETVAREAARFRKLPGSLRVLPKARQALKKVLIENMPETIRSYQAWNLEKQVKSIEERRLQGRAPKREISRSHVAKFREELGGLVATVRAEGIEIVLCTSPALMDAGNLDQYREIFLDSRRFFIELSFVGMMDAVASVNAAIRDVAAEHRVLLVDLATLLPKTTDYFSDNAHFTDRGAQVVAEAVAAELRGSGFLEVAQDDGASR